MPIVIIFAASTTIADARSDGVWADVSSGMMDRAGEEDMGARTASRRTSRAVMSVRQHGHESFSLSMTHITMHAV
jgi:hypothetical protein